MFRIKFETFNWIFVFNLITQCICLKDVKITVPEAVAVGDNVILSCDFDLEKAPLYSVRWYLEHEEFYRYVRHENPPGISFPIAGMEVDLKKSTENNVFIKSVTQTLSGNYQCEVSADAPSFHTESRTASMLVAELPQTEPILTIYGMAGIENQHAITFGESFKASCVSGHSQPAANFTWFINGFQFPSTNSGLRRIDGFDHHEAWSEIMVNVDNQVMKATNHLTLVVRCEASIFDLYRGSAQTELNVIKDIFWSPYEGKISPTIDQKTTSNSAGVMQGDPGNSALTDSGNNSSGCGQNLSIEKFQFIYLMISFRILIHLF